MWKNGVTVFLEGLVQELLLGTVLRTETQVKSGISCEETGRGRRFDCPVNPRMIEITNM